MDHLVGLLFVLEPWFVPLLAGFVAGAVLTRLSMVIAHRVGALARPDHRTLHQLPTPRLGGLGLGGAMMLCMALWPWWAQGAERSLEIVPSMSLAILVIIAGGAAMLLGLADDLLDLPPLNKLILQFSVAAIPVIGGISFGGTLWRFGNSPFVSALIVLAPIFSVLWIVSIINVFNFLDGVDGQAVLMHVMLCFVALAVIHMLPTGFQLREGGRVPTTFVPPLVMMLGAGLGFLGYNASPAKTFMGDSGSHFLGFLWGSLPLWICTYLYRIHEGLNPDGTFYLGIELGPPIASLVAFAIALAPFIADFSGTLLSRRRRGYPLTQAHRQHLYQRLVLAGWSHSDLLVLHFFYYSVFALLAIAFARPTAQSAERAFILLIGFGLLSLYKAYVAQQESAAGLQPPGMNPDRKR